MKFLQRRIGCGRRVLLSLIACAVVADFTALVAITAQDAVSAPVVQPVISDVQLLSGEPAGVRIIEFNLDAPKGTKFFVWWTHTGQRGASSTGPVWEKSGDEPAHIRVTIEYNLNFAGDRSQNVLLSREPTLQFRFEATGGVKEGLTGLASAPLFSVDPNERQLDFITASTDRLAFDGKGQRRLFFASRKSEIGKPADAITPRTELLVGTYIEPRRSQRGPADQLAALWHRQRQEIGSTHIKFRIRRSGFVDYLPVKRDEFGRLLDDARLNERPEQFEAILNQIVKPDRRGRLWSDGEFWSIGLKTHERIRDMERVYDGEFDLRRMDRQIDVVRGDASQWHRMTIFDFRLVQSVTDFTLFEQENKPPSQLQLRRSSEGNEFRVLADWTTGFVQRVTFDSARVIDERLQFAPRRYPGGIVFATLKLHLVWREGELDRLEAISVDEAQFNENLPADAFKLPAAPGMTVIVHEDGRMSMGGRKEHVRIGENVPDLAEFLRKRSPDAQPPK